MKRRSEKKEMNTRLVQQNHHDVRQRVRHQQAKIEAAGGAEDVGPLEIAGEGAAEAGDNGFDATKFGAVRKIDVEQPSAMRETEVEKTSTEPEGERTSFSSPRLPPAGNHCQSVRVPSE